MGKAFIQESTLTEIADAIRLRKGVNDTFLPSQMATALKGATVALDVIEDGVNFYDYDGTLLYAFSKEEVLAQDESNNYTWQLPPLPDRTKENLTNEGWNRTADSIRTYMASNSWYLAVGCTYHTTDDITYIWMEVSENSPTRQLRIKPSTANAVIIDWGDGFRYEPIDSSSDIVVTHTYSSVKVRETFIIKISCSSGTYYFPGQLCGSADSDNEASGITKIHLSNKVTSVRSRCFCYLVDLEKITIPSSVNVHYQYLFAYTKELRHVTLAGDSNTTNIDMYGFLKATGMKSAAWNYQISSTYGFSESTIERLSRIASSQNARWCYKNTRIKRLLLGVGTLKTEALKDCSSLYYLKFNGNLTTIEASAIRNCTSLVELVIPETVTSIGASALAGNTSLKRLVMLPATPPTITSTTLNGLPEDCNILIPAAYINDYMTAQYWADYASQMRGLLVQQ